MLPKAYHKLGVSINGNELKHSMVFNPMSKNNFVESKVVTIMYVAMIFPNLEN
jgi:hypothetical protein